MPSRWTWAETCKWDDGAEYYESWVSATSPAREVFDSMYRAMRKQVPPAYRQLVEFGGNLKDWGAPPVNMFWYYDGRRPHFHAGVFDGAPFVITSSEA